MQGSDRGADVRGLAVKVIGVPGKKLIPGLEVAPTQDFLASHSPVTPFRNADEFVRGIYASRNMALALPRFFAAFGIGRSRTILKKFAAGAREDRVAGSAPFLQRAVGRVRRVRGQVQLHADGSRRRAWRVGVADLGRALRQRPGRPVGARAARLRLRRAALPRRGVHAYRGRLTGVERAGGALRHRRAADHPEAGGALAARAAGERVRGDAVLPPRARASGTPATRRHDARA